MSDGKTQLESTEDRLGRSIMRGDYIVYPVQLGHSVHLQVAKVLDIYSETSLTHVGPETRLIVRSASDWDGSVRLSLKSVRLQDARNTVRVFVVPFEYNAVLETVEVRAYGV